MVPTFSVGMMRKKPVVGLGVVGTKTRESDRPFLSTMVPVTKPMERTPGNARLFGRPSAREAFGSGLLVATAAFEFLRHLWARAAGRESVIRQPPSRRLEYAGPAGSRREVIRP